MLDWIVNMMQNLGYFGIVLLMFLENVFPPIPSELVMPLAGYVASQEKLTMIGVVLAGMIGSVLGALPLYFLGKKVGADRLKEWADKHGKWLTVSREDIDKSIDWFDRHGGTAVLMCRLIPGIRSLISIPAGIDNMNLAAFLGYSAVGTGIWAGLLAYAGYLLGGNFQKVDQYFGPASYVVLGIIVITYIVRFIKQHKATAGDGEKPVANNTT